MLRSPQRLNLTKSFQHISAFLFCTLQNNYGKRFPHLYVRRMQRPVQSRRTGAMTCYWHNFIDGVFASKHWQTPHPVTQVSDLFSSYYCFVCVLTRGHRDVSLGGLGSPVSCSLVLCTVLRVRSHVLAPCLDGTAATKNVWNNNIFT